MSGGTALADILPGIQAKLQAWRSELREPRNVHDLVRPASSNTALAAPEGFRPAPDVVTASYAVPAERLYATLRAVGAAQPRTTLDAAFNEALQAHYTVRSALLGFPDLVWTQALRADAGRSQVVIWSRSVLGRYDFGVNQARLRIWLAAVDAALRAGRKEH